MNAFFTQIVIPNKGSVARDHLANERTLLAWTLTSVTFLTLGIGFMQFFRIEQKSQCKDIATVIPISKSIYDKDVVATVLSLCRPIGGMCIIMGMLTLFFGSFRYFQVQNMLMKDEFPVMRLGLVVLIIINLSILILLLVLNFEIAL
ncbi:hypothetical protein KGF56_000660 [Candida oxycetoniae]|uniref:DUF202 domain-containing protein n=1 Tax=Candida oxycetoniae TaxID=497107 RepID=A0AAI9T0H2_9ASCO|nr:uncharacterized protein KGF56_000660 [Candida oxycetoniae]KAI3406528.1 hypothetical protein KGF56_000660 [Candida oxycetoniae]